MIKLQMISFFSRTTTSKLAQRWFNDHGYTVMKWPAQSPDINSIEHLWWDLKRRLAKYEMVPSVEELWEHCQVEWEKIPKEVCPQGYKL